MTTVLKWVHDFNARGPQALIYRPSGGARSHIQPLGPLVDEVLREAQQAAAQSKNGLPAAESASDEPHGAPAPPANWLYLRWLCSWLGCITGRIPGRETVRRLVKRLGYSWKKAKKLLGKACPERRAQFAWQPGELLTQAQQDQGPLVVFADEAHLHLDTDLGWGWAPRGQRLYVHSTSPPLARKLTCFGFYALGATEPVRLWTTHWANAETTSQALHALRERYPGRLLVLVWDNVRYHHAHLVRRCAEELAIQLRYLPPYSPDLMPVENLWQWLRQQLTALHCHEMKTNCATASLDSKPRSTTTQSRPLPPISQDAPGSGGRKTSGLKGSRFSNRWVLLHITAPEMVQPIYQFEFGLCHELLVWSEMGFQSVTVPVEPPARASM